MVVILALSALRAADAQTIWDDVEHGYAESNGVNIHYAAIGAGPPVVMIHGLPDFWYSWRDQMAGLLASAPVPTLVPKPGSPNVTQGNLPSHGFAALGALGLPWVMLDREIRSLKIRVSVV